VPLTAPILDDRTFEDIFAEARLRIPRYNPDWTDFNESDPGITLLQLFAWLTEMMLYRLNQVPERNYIKFLQLLGLELRPAQPATAHITFTPKAGVVSAGPVPQGTQISAPSPTGGVLIYETSAGLSLIPFPLSDVQAYDGAVFTVVTAANATPGTGFQPFGYQPPLNSALYLGFTPPKTLPPPGQPQPAFPQDMRFRIFLPADATAGVPQLCSAVQNPPAPPVTLQWEYRSKANPAVWRKLNVFQDGSSAFTREGDVLVQGPTDPVVTTEGKVTDPRYWFRVRVAANSYGAGVTPVVDFIRPNTVDAVNLTTVRDESLGTSDGTPSQTFTLQNKPILAKSLQVSVQSPGLAAETWTEVDDFLSSVSGDTVFVLNKATGVVTFGDGRRGEIPVAGADVTATVYRYGGGTAGNVAAGAIGNVMTNIDGLDKATNERPAVGGQDEQDPEDLKQSAPARLRCRDRAVTPDDFKAIAKQAGGVARATALAETSPDHPGVEVAGAITVVVVPDAKDMPPQPSSDLIRSVCNYMDGFRLITTELYVRGPEYSAITVEASALAPSYESFDQVSLDVTTAIDAYLDPIKGKLDFGEELFPTNLLGAILSLDSVSAVTSMKVYVDNVLHTDLSQPVKIPPHGLFYGFGHTITVGPLEGQ
jgi:predicted phage baseplate assembly protein